MVSLFLPLLERVGLIILLANLLMISPFYKKMMYQRDSYRVRWILILTFSVFAIISNFTGVLVTAPFEIGSGGLVNLSSHTSIANTRTLTIGMSGLIVLCRLFCRSHLRYGQMASRGNCSLYLLYFLAFDWHFIGLCW